MLNKRILWLFNHSTLIKSEVPILYDLGYEVYVPKNPPYFDVSVVINWNLDEKLSIPVDDLKILNKVNFYENRIPKEAMDIINEYFDIVIFGIYIEPLKSLITKFNGVLIFHPFGVGNTTSYTKIIQELAGTWVLKAIEKLGNRFWFGQAYENLMEIECDLFKRRTINLPIGLKDSKIKDTWNGTSKKILFICPKIKTNTYYNSIYQKFKKDFTKIPYSIGGAQPISVENDDTVLGFLSQDEYEQLYPSHSVMFYHSEEKRHIHYHPFEAIKCGLPLIFMADGLLDKLGGKNLPGRCKTIKEARKKCLRIINNDTLFINKIKKSQAVLLEKMSYEYCRDIWKTSFTKIEKEVIAVKDNINRVKKLGVVLPAEYIGGVLDYTIRLLLAIKKGLELNNTKMELVFGYLDHPNYDDLECLKRIVDAGIEMRRFNWEIIDKDRISEAIKILGFDSENISGKYCVLNDNIRYFEDCDFLLFTSDRAPEQLYINQPYGVIAHDYIQRYLPEMFGDYYEESFINLSRGAEVIYTTTQVTKNDCIQYAGVPANKIKLLPLFFDAITANSLALCKEPYFLWSTNVARHKNHKIALKALSDYYAEGGSIACYVTGVDTELFKKRNLDSNNLYVKEINEMIASDKYLRKNIKIFGNLPKSQYIQLLQNALFFLHAGHTDNGNGTAFDAAMLGVPTITSKYPAMENMDNIIQLGFLFFDRYDSNSLKKLLMIVEENPAKLKDNLPLREELMKHTIEDNDLCNNIYNTIMSNII